MIWSRKNAFGIIETLIALGLMTIVAVLVGYFIQDNKIPKVQLNIGASCEGQAQAIINHIVSFNENPQIRNLQPNKTDFTDNFWIDPHPLDTLFTPNKASPLLRDSIVYFGDNLSSEVGDPTPPPNSMFNVHTIQQIRNATTWAINIYNNHLKTGNAPNICNDPGLQFKPIELANGDLTFADLSRLLPGNIDLEVNEDIEGIFLKIGLVHLNDTDQIIRCGDPISIQLNDPSGIFLQVAVDSVDSSERAKGNSNAIKKCLAKAILNYETPQKLNIPTARLDLLSPDLPLNLLNSNGTPLQNNSCTCTSINGCNDTHLEVRTPVLSFNEPGVTFICRTNGPSFTYSSYPNWMACHALGASIQLISPPYNSETQAQIIFSNLAENNNPNTLEVKAIGIGGRVATEFQNLEPFQFRVKTPRCQSPSTVACGQLIPNDCGVIGECGTRVPSCPNIVCPNQGPVLSDCGTLCAPNTTFQCAPADTISCGQPIPDLSGCGASCPGVGTQNCPQQAIAITPEPQPVVTTTLRPGMPCTPDCMDPTLVPCGAQVPDNNGCIPNTCGMGTMNCSVCSINCAPPNTIECNLPIPDLNNCPGFQSGLTCPGVGTKNCDAICSVRCADPNDVPCGLPVPDLNSCPGFQAGVTCPGTGTRNCRVPQCDLGLDENGNPVCPGFGEAQRLYSQGLCVCP